VTHPSKLSVQYGFAYKEPDQFTGCPHGAKNTDLSTQKPQQGKGV